VVQTRTSSGEEEVLSDEEPGVAYRGNVVVMVDRFSASASEILAGALQDYRRAVVVGTAHTHGKGTVQVLVDLDRLRQTPGEPLGVLKLTIQQYFRINGASTQWRGVVPDVLLPDPAAHIESGERFLDHSIPWSETHALKFAPWPKATWDDKKLAQASIKRTEAVPVFAKVRARSKLLEARRDRTRVPLQLDAWRARHDGDEKELEAVDPKIEEGKPRFAVDVISYDGSKPLPPRAKSKGAEGGKGKRDRLAGWIDELARDPWVEESLHVLDDMRAAR
jgi:carboxyl-terminal processing protease